MPSKRILVIAESINIDDSSGSKANVALIRSLNHAGCELFILHYTRIDIQLDGLECRSIPENRSSLIFFLSRFQRKIQHWFGWNLAKQLEPKFGFSFTFFNDAKSIERELDRIDPSDYDMVLTLSKGASFRPHYALLNLPEFHHNWMAYIHDPYPFHYYPEPYKWSEPGFEQKIRFFKNVSEKCRWAAYPSLYLAEWMEEHFHSFRNKRVIIPHQLQQQNLIGKVPSYFQNRFIILHAGTLMKQRSPESLLVAYSKFLRKNPDAAKKSKLVFIGNNSYHKSTIVEYQNEIPSLELYPNLPYANALAMQNAASVNVILEFEGNLSPFLPGKFPHCVNAERPILHIGPKKSECRRLLGENYAFSVEVDDLERLTMILEELYYQWTVNKCKMQRRDLEFYLSKENLKSIMESCI
ncbi:UDP-glycosyltransferase [Christiangramia sp. OXR-203]|uniref:UDP-glycosyltransferase n=1 Tax=Christiangramia sp. OXR-203 TaxID=3100176 RepID=UPI002AC9697E|nr:UDP-glycosyltransferase [Christiangramia sp. OXR-203]WPY97901.1 UDP-glycosyltransferase [Christiangramia sp. OXR-203]